LSCIIAQKHPRHKLKAKKTGLPAKAPTSFACGNTTCLQEYYVDFIGFFNSHGMNKLLSVACRPSRPLRKPFRLFEK